MPASDFPMPKVLYNLRPKGGLVGNRTLLSCTREGTKVDLFDKDDESGRQKWYFVPVSSGVYNITVYAGIDDDRKQFLSCTPDGITVDLWTQDDQSGRQQWALEPLPDGCFHIKPMGGLTSNRVYLSITEEGTKVDLWMKDDRSGRQRWQLIPEDIELDRIEFDTSKGLAISQPDFIVTQIVYNNSSVEQESKVTFEKKATETSNWQHEINFGFKVGYETKWNVPKIVGSESKFTFEFSAGYKKSWGGSTSTEDTRTYEMPVRIPAKSKVTAKATVSQYQLDVPYKAMGRSKITGEDVIVFGKWSGLQAGEITYTIDETTKVYKKRKRF